jgi:hypothetical protein
MLKNKYKKFGVMEYIQYMSIFGKSRMQIRKNGLTNWKTFLTNILKNIIQQFVSISSSVVKYCMLL